jgi:L-rhamnonate dehydratase
MRKDRIVDVRVSFVASDESEPAEPTKASPEEAESAGSNGSPPAQIDRAKHWLGGKVANPMTKYPEFRDNRDAGIRADDGGTVVVEVESASGEVGLSTTSGLAAAAIIHQHLARLVRGERASAHTRIWDRMFSSTLRYGRKGLVLHAISAVDLAIWDLHGKVLGEPVHELIGGKIRDAVQVYATGPSPALAARLGFAGAKLPLVYAPCEGEEGFRRNVEIAEQARASVPDDFPLMYDCWMALDVDYAVRLAHAVAPLGFTWIEEPLPPDDYAGLRRIRDRMPPTMTLNTGEHEYTAAGFKLLCEAGVDVIQPDLGWCGGMTEVLRIADVARVYGVKVIPHTCGMPNYHFVVTQPHGDLAEFPVLSPDGEALAPQHAPLMLGEDVPENGWLKVSDKPGFGLTLNPEIRLVPAVPATRTAP